MRTISTKFNYNLLKEVKGTTCINCGDNCGDNIVFHHIIPISIGGYDIITNIVPLCSKCHNLLHQVFSKNNGISHSELIKIGMRKAKENGKIIGRKKITKDTIPQWFLEQALPMYKKGETIASISKHFNMSRTTIYKYLKLLDFKF